MAGEKIFILADDLTGANDTAIQFVKHGFSALVAIDDSLSNPPVFSGYDVVSINSDSRRMDGQTAYD
ncbi:MAG: four-carbon acid sugar kinase family protein, partial [Spirochaetes bacterium]|nr:four-carbon acid sugar kinase family protein [Spirochaetota bacterium]